MVAFFSMGNSVIDGRDCKQFLAKVLLKCES